METQRAKSAFTDLTFAIHEAGFRHQPGWIVQHGRWVWLLCNREAAAASIDFALLTEG